MILMFLIDGIKAMASRIRSRYSSLFGIVLVELSEVVPISDVVCPGTMMSPFPGGRIRFTTMSQIRRSVTSMVPLLG